MSLNLLRQKKGALSARRNCYAARLVLHNVLPPLCFPTIGLRTSRDFPALPVTIARFAVTYWGSQPGGGTGSPGIIQEPNETWPSSKPF